MGKDVGDTSKETQAGFGSRWSECCGTDRWENPGYGGYVAKAEVAPAWKICSRAEIQDTDLKVFCDLQFITGGHRASGPASGWGGRLGGHWNQGGKRREVIRHKQKQGDKPESIQFHKALEDNSTMKGFKKITKQNKIQYIHFYISETCEGVSGLLLIVLPQIFF